MEVRPIDANALKSKGKFNQQTGSFIELGDLEKAPTLDYEPVGNQHISEDFARFITKGIAQIMAELKIDLPSMIYEDIEYSLINRKFETVWNFIENYIANNSRAKMDEEVKE